MSLPPVLGAPPRRDHHFEHSYFYLKNISTGISAIAAGIQCRQQAINRRGV